MDVSDNSETPRQTIINFLEGPAPISKTPYPPVIEPKKQTNKSDAKPFDRRKSSLAGVTPRTLLQNVMMEKVNRNSSVLHFDDLGQNILKASRKSRIGSLAGLCNIVSSESSDPENSEAENDLSADKTKKRIAVRITGKRKDVPGRASLERELKLTESDVSETGRSVRSRVSSHSSKSPLKAFTSRSTSSPLTSQKRFSSKRKKQAQSSSSVTDDELSASEKESISSKKSKQIGHKTVYEQPQKSNLSTTFSFTPPRNNKTDANKEKRSNSIPSNVTLVKKGSVSAYTTDIGSSPVRTQKSKNESVQDLLPPRVLSLRSGTRIRSVVDDSSSFKSLSSTSVEDYDDYVGSSPSARLARQDKNERDKTLKHSRSRLISKTSADSTMHTKQPIKSMNSTPSSSSSHRSQRQAAVQESDGTLLNKARLDTDAQRLFSKRQSRIQYLDDEEKQGDGDDDPYRSTPIKNSRLKEMSSVSQKTRDAIEKSNGSRLEKDDIVSSRAQQNNMTRKASVHEISRSLSETENVEDMHKNNTSAVLSADVSYRTPEKSKHSRIFNQKDSVTSKKNIFSKSFQNNTKIDDILDYETIMNASRRLTERQSDEEREIPFLQRSISHAINDDDEDTMPYDQANTFSKNNNPKSKRVDSRNSGPETEPYESEANSGYESPGNDLQPLKHSHANKVSTSIRKSRYSNVHTSPALTGASPRDKNSSSNWLPLAERVSQRLAATRNAERTDIGQTELTDKDYEKTPVTPVRSSRSKSRQVLETPTNEIHSRNTQNKEQNNTDDGRTSIFTNYQIKEVSHINKSKLHSSPIPKRLSKGNSMISIGISPIREVEESPPESRKQHSTRERSASAALVSRSPKPNSVRQKSPAFHTPRENTSAEAPTLILPNVRKSRRTKERSQSPQAGPSGWRPGEERQQSSRLEKSSQLKMRRSKSDEQSVYLSEAQTVETKDALPISLAKNIIQQYSGLKVPNSALPCLEECIEGFWDKTFSTLSAYAHHAGRDIINKSDVELYIYRLGLAHDRNSINALIEKLLPFEMRCQVIPMAIAGNKLI